MGVAPPTALVAGPTTRSNEPSQHSSGGGKGDGSRSSSSTNKSGRGGRGQGGKCGNRYDCKGGGSKSAMSSSNDP
jgi:hypothetical protein